MKLEQKLDDKNLRHLVTIPPRMIINPLNHRHPQQALEKARMGGVLVVNNVLVVVVADGSRNAHGGCGGGKMLMYVVVGGVEVVTGIMGVDRIMGGNLAAAQDLDVCRLEAHKLLELSLEILNITFP